VSLLTVRVSGRHTRISGTLRAEGVTLYADKKLIESFASDACINDLERGSILFLNRFSCVAIVSFLLSASALAESVVADFSDLSFGEEGRVLTSQGVTFESGHATAMVLPDNRAGGSGLELTFCGYCNPTESVSIYLQSGISFELDSFRFGSVAEQNTGFPFEGTITGYLESGGTVTQEINIASGAAQLFAFDGAWSGLTSVDIEINLYPDYLVCCDPFAIDDITLQTVPVPAAVWLFGSALAGLGWLRRKQTI
jgi:hypothetical protein